jgi:hypothetical protein
MATRKPATKRKRTPKREKELKPVYDNLDKIVVTADSNATLKDLHYARLLFEGEDQLEAYKKAYKPTTENLGSLHPMASRKSRHQSVLREIDRLRRQSEEEAEKTDKLEEILNDGPRLRMEALKTVYLLMTSPDTADAVRLKAAERIGDLKHVDAFVRTGSTFNIDNSKNQNNLIGINLESNNAGELRTGIMNELKGFLGEAPAQISTAREAVVEAEVLDV